MLNQQDILRSMFWCSRQQRVGLATTLLCVASLTNGCVPDFERDDGDSGSVARDASGSDAFAPSADAFSPSADAFSPRADAFIPTSDEDAGRPPGPSDGGRSDDAGRPADIVLASCTYSEVNDAIQSARDGAIIEIGADDCDWGADWVLAALGGRHLVIRGQGIDRTIIRRTAAIGTNGDPLFYLNCQGGSVDISAMRLVGNDELQTRAQRVTDLDTGMEVKNCVDYRVHDIQFERFSDAGLLLTANSGGVVYRSRFLSNYKCWPDGVRSPGDPDDYPCYGYGISVSGNLTGNGDWGALALGSANADFIEDNYFYDNRHAITSNRGARYVARYNELVGSQRTTNWGILDVHGDTRSDPSGSPTSCCRGGRSVEIYGNIIRSESDRSPYGILLRGGDGVVFGNRIEGRFGATVDLVLEDADRDCTETGTGRVMDQTTEMWVWDNTHVPPLSGGEAQLVRTVHNSQDCSRRLREGHPGDPSERWEYMLSMAPDYTPYPYPHPLR